MANSNWKLLLFRALLIVTAGFWVFAPALRGDWVMDDSLYLTQNVLRDDPARLWKIWFEPGSLIEYYPLEETAQAFQWYLWRMDPLGYHFTSLLLHLAGGLLVWRLLAKFGLSRAWLGGFFFVIHPAVVDSVAWISELKNTLSLPPFLLAMCFWIDYEERGRRRDYFLALALFLIAMLCKISMSLFPVVILLYAWWKRGRIAGRDLAAALPFLALSLMLGFATIFAGVRFREALLESPNDPEIGGVIFRLALAGQSISFYFWKCVCPTTMLLSYPKWPVNPSSLGSFLPWPILAGVIGWCWYRRANWGRHALLGLGFFLINLSPFLGFTAVSYMTFTWVMDHFLYLPLIGLIGLAIAAFENLEGRISHSMRPPLALLTAMVLVLLAWESRDYAQMFIGPERLWVYTTERDPTSWLAYNNLGNVLLETGRVSEAIEKYQRALQLNPNLAEAYNNLGVALAEEGCTAEAIKNYELALKFSPHFGLAHSNLADALSKLSRRPEAIDHFQQVLLVDPHNGDARAKLTNLKARQKLSEP